MGYIPPLSLLNHWLLSIYNKEEEMDFLWTHTAQDVRDLARTAMTWTPEGRRKSGRPKET